MPDPQVIGKYPKLHHSLVAVIVHLSAIPSAFFGLGLLAWVLPLLLWLVFRRMSPLVDHHGQHAINAGLWFACLSALLQGLVWWRPQGARGGTILLGAIAILWILLVLRHAHKAWQGWDLRSQRVSWIG